MSIQGKIKANLEAYRQHGIKPQRTLPKGSSAAISIEPPVCRFRGPLVGKCKCLKENSMYICGILKIRVREHQRPGHPNDPQCNPDCPKFEVGGTSNEITEAQSSG